MIAGEQKILVFYPNPQPPINPAALPLSLAGATVTLEWLSPTLALKTASMTCVSTDPDPTNHYAYYRTLNTDFPVGGVYTLQVFGSFPDGDLQKTPKCQWNVGDSF